MFAHHHPYGPRSVIMKCDLADAAEQIMSVTVSMSSTDWCLMYYISDVLRTLSTPSPSSADVLRSGCHAHVSRQSHVLGQFIQ